ncbi:MAG: FAD:protein FMN transferase [Candidatus Omnitrophica bacterium]|nr:FAD:protein FMN transferase [Candidatus Omnitrophota bacterium]
MNPKSKIPNKCRFEHSKFEFILSFVLGILTFVFLSGCQQKPLYKDTQLMMGTFIQVISPDKNASQIAFGEIRRIEGLLSKYIPESEVSKLNQGGSLKVSPEVFFILKKSKEFFQTTGGVFDITAASLVDLWGFTNKKYYLPSEKEIQETLKLTGSDKIILRNDDNVVKFTVNHLKIDLGAIAKGFALDCAAEKLKQSGIEDCLINAGGQVLCLGTKFGRPWKVAIKDPRSDKIIQVLQLKNQSASTSGDYEQYFTKGNKRYSHIFNPKTGYPAESGLISVTVVAPDGLTADALSTSIFVLGKENGMELLKKFSGTKVYLVEKK